MVGTFPQKMTPARTAIPHPPAMRGLAQAASAAALVVLATLVAQSIAAGQGPRQSALALWPTPTHALLMFASVAAAIALGANASLRVLGRAAALTVVVAGLSLLGAYMGGVEPRETAVRVATGLRWSIPTYALALALIVFTARRAASALPTMPVAAAMPIAAAVPAATASPARVGAPVAMREADVRAPASREPGVGALLREAYWEQDEHGVITRVDDALQPPALRLKLGRARWDDGALPLDGPDWQAHRDGLGRHERFTDLAYVWTDAAGRRHVCIDSGVPRYAADGRFCGYAGISRDGAAELAGTRARRLATAALLAVGDPVLWIEAAAHTGWRIVWANAAACQLLGRTDRELRELAEHAMFAPASAAVIAAVDQALREHRERRLHGHVARKYGELRSVEIRVEPLTGGAPMRACAALLLHDQSADQERLRNDSQAIETLRRRMRERSLELDVTAKELESFTYTVSHDLRAPIRVVEGFARALQEDYHDRLDKIGHDHLHRILSAAARMNQMIDALLTLSRLSAQPVAAEPVDLSRAADIIAEELRVAQPDRNASVSVQPGMVAEGDRTLLRIALENLLGNAWKYTGKRARAEIEFSCTGSGPGAVYCIRDNGEGFDMRFADRLFGVFQRLHSAADFPGTGIGLATVQRIVRRHGGRVWAESEPGKGSRFYFTLWDRRAR
jgi:signal transduction histidine kinase